MTKDAEKIAVIGLGYVGLPLAVELGKHQQTVGFDIDAGRIAELRDGHDRTREVDPAELAEARHLHYASDAADIADCTVYIVTVPTPIDAHKQPDLTPLRAASKRASSAESTRRAHRRSARRRSPARRSDRVRPR